MARMICRECSRNASWIGVASHRKGIKIQDERRGYRRLCRSYERGPEIVSISYAVIRIFAPIARRFLSHGRGQKPGDVSRSHLGRAGQEIPAGRSLHAWSRTEMAREAQSRSGVRERYVSPLRRSQGVHFTVTLQFEGRIPETSRAVPAFVGAGEIFVTDLRDRGRDLSLC